MTRMQSFLFVIASLVVANAVSFITLSRNVVVGVYPIEADSIAIPLVEGAILSSLILVLLCTAIMIPTSRKGAVISTILSGIAVFFAVVVSLSWAMPNHYTMALAYGSVAIVGGILARNYLKQWRVT